ncbi:hypothetical protein [Mycobacteroides abscessus]|uniref:hypothetical protein n=1 Tax=Mycobacteroides abscessus TaxID=36809 RepID=UPI0009A8BDB6|nr:hypothetical protein [Mycobacteroides abscessus]SLF39509.1 Uncharacterised protein [Mycobacteroides abscessus subsp. bolletii]
MALPTKAEVAVATKGRLPENDPLTAQLLAAAIGAVRDYCGWHITPPKEDDEVTIDGSGASELALPTLHLTALTELTEDGAALDVSAIEWSECGMLRKPGRCYWTDRYRGVKAKITHGYDDLPALNLAILSMVSRKADDATGREVIGPYQWFPAEEVADGSAFSGSERATLDKYCLEDPA